MKKHIIQKLTILFLIVLLTFILPIESFAITEDTQKKPIVVVSLGDSYSSGEGNEPFYNQDLPWNEKVKDRDWLAHRSENSWSGQLEIGGKTLEDYRVKEYDPNKSINWFFAASSGAETKHINNSFDKYYNKEEGERKYEGWYTLSPQIDIFGNSDSESLTGKVDYVTMTLGGNDVQWI